MESEAYFFRAVHSRPVRRFCMESMCCVTRTTIWKGRGGRLQVRESEACDLVIRQFWCSPVVESTLAARTCIVRRGHCG